MGNRGVLRRATAAAAIVTMCLGLAGWGTLSDPIRLGPGVEDSLRDVIREYGVNADAMLAQLDDRSGPHPIHQFIAYQAFLLLKEDPAYADGESGFPTGEEINAWDGIERDEGGVMRQRGSADHLPAGLGPTLPGVGGPSADAEGRRGGGYNRLYNGRAHYWNPWLEDGEAPTLAGVNFARLVHAIVEGASPNDRAHYAAYMAHYLADVTSAKHADAFTIDSATVQRLVGLADAWVKEGGANNLLGVGLQSVHLREAEQLLRARVSAINGGMADAYWARIDRHIATIGADTFLQRGDFYKVDIPPSSMATATACYLHALDHRGLAQSVDQFFTFFDPFYLNGPIVDKVVGDTEFKMCTPFGEHLNWETNPKHYKTVLDWMAGGPKAMLWKDGLKGNHRPFERDAGYFDPDWDAAKPAMETAVEKLTKACSKEVHGAIGDDRDFRPGHEEYLTMAIRCVYTAYRASITALRLEAAGRKVDGTDLVKLALTIKNLADQPAKLHKARVMVKGADGTLSSRPGWTVALDETVTAGDTIQIRIRIEEVPDEVKVEDLVVDLRGEVTDTPDSGWRRAAVEDRPLELVRNPDATSKLAGGKGPIDVIVVMDTTGSMQGSIDSMRANAIAAIKKLKETSKDIRLAVTTFRDLGEAPDLPHFKVQPFTSDLDAAFAFLNTLSADGGGNIEEDQLHGISLGLELWEKEGKTDRFPTKIIIVVTDAPAKSPDTRGNTFQSIARRAYNVDPAHIYSIIVGDHATALEHAALLAKDSGGKVLTAATGDEVAAAVLEAVADAAATYSPVPTPESRGTWIWVIGGLLSALGSGLLIAGLVVNARRARVTAGV